MIIKLINLRGKRFGRLIVLDRTGSNKHGQPKWLCKCDCGKMIIVTGYNLRYKHTKSCGCLQIDRITTHNKTHEPLYNRWRCMKQRCYSKNTKYYKNYGARGITVCDEWINNFQSFYDWAMDNGYQDNLELDRIDVNGNYEPSNCRWITHIEQQHNRRNNFKITYNGMTKTITEWSRYLKIPYSTLYKRIKFLNWDLEKAFRNK